MSLWGYLQEISPPWYQFQSDESVSRNRTSQSTPLQFRNSSRTHGSFASSSLELVLYLRNTTERPSTRLSSYAFQADHSCGNHLEGCPCPLQACGPCVQQVGISYVVFGVLRLCFHFQVVQCTWKKILFKAVRYPRSQHRQDSGRPDRARWRDQMATIIGALSDTLGFWVLNVIIIVEDISEFFQVI